MAPCSTTSSSSALFIATKLEAFRERGRGDVFASHDLEDIVTVVDGRPEIVAEVDAAASEVRAYIASDVRSLLDNPDFVEALPGFLLPDAASQARRGLKAGAQGGGLTGPYIGFRLRVMKWSRSTLKLVQVFLEAPEGEFCGSDLMDRAGVSPGVVYPFLVRWEEEGLLKARWEQQDASDLKRPRKKFYRLTRTGKTKARDALKPFVAYARPILEAR